MAHDDWSWQDEMAAAAAEPDPDYGRDIDDEDDRVQRSLEQAGQPGPLVHKYAPMFGSELDYEDEEYEDAHEWRPGECDTCSGRHVVTEGPFGPIVCACAIGQGAPLGQCVCGPDSEPVAASSAGGAR